MKMPRVIIAFLITLFVLNSCQENRLRNDENIEFLIQVASNAKQENVERLRASKKALALTSEKRNDSINRNRLFKISECFLDLHNDKYSLKTLLLLRERSVLAKDSNHVAQSHRYLGYYYLGSNVHDSAYSHYTKALKIYSKLKNDQGLMKCYYGLSVLQSIVYDNWNAQYSAIQAYRYAKKLNNIVLQYKSLMMQAVILNDLGEYNLAISKNHDIIKLIDRTKDKNLNTEICLNNIGGAYQNGKNHRAAIAYFYKALNRNPHIMDIDPALYARLLNNIAFSKMKLGELEGVESMLKEALRIRVSNKSDSEDIISSLCNFSRFWLQSSDTLKAKYYSNKALKLAYKNGNANTVLQTLAQISKTDVKNSVIYFNDYIKLSDSLQLAERKNRNKFARIAFETDEITVEKDRAIKQKWVISAIASAMLLLLTLLSIIKLQRAKQKELVLIQHQQKADESIYQLINDQQLQVDEGRQAEKRRIAQELHDGIMNRLASTRLNLFILNKNQDESTIKKCLGFINNIQDIEKEIRQVAHDLNEEIFSQNKGFALLLETLFEDYRSIEGTRLFTEIDSAFNWEMTESVLRMNIYRMLQEALQNAYKYAEAKNVFVTLTREENFVRIIVHDDGKGFDINKVKKGMGLKSIGDRTASLKGEFKIISGKKEGTILNILLPLSKKN